MGVRARVQRCCSRAGAVAASLPALLQHPVARDLLLLYSLTFLLLLPVCCFRLRNSLYYHQSNEVLKERMLTENTARVRQAEDFLSRLTAARLTNLTRSDTLSHVDVLFTVVTARRNHNPDGHAPAYLPQVVWRLLATLEEARHRGFTRTTGVLVCDVDVRYKDNIDVNNVKQHVSVLYRFETEKRPHIISTDLKHRHDYVFCLNASVRHAPRHVVMMEDDALPHDDMYDVMDAVLRNQIENRKQGDSLIPDPDPPLYVKLYHPDRLISYIDLGRDRLPELAAFGAFFGTLGACLYSFIRRRSQVSFHTLWCVFIVYFTLLALCVGRTNVIHLKTFLSPHLYTYVPAAECCTQAVIFPLQSAREMVDQLHNHPADKKWPNDRVMHDIARTHRQGAYMVLPNVYTHIGLYSSLHTNKKVNPYVI